MVSAIPTNQPVQSLTQPQMPKSQGLVINIVHPEIYGDHYTRGASAKGAEAATPALPSSNGAPATPPSMNPSATNPFMTPPQQLLQNLYTEAQNARNAAEQARNAYLNTAQQLESQAAAQPSPSVTPPGFGQPAVNQAINYAAPPQAFPGYPAGYPMMPGQPPVMTPPQPFANVVPQPFTPPPAAQTLEAPPQAPPTNLPPVQAPQGENNIVPFNRPAEANAPVDVNQLTQKIATPASLQEKVDAIGQVLYLSSQVDPATGQRYTFPAPLFDLLEDTARPRDKEKLKQMQQLPQPALDDANYVRQTGIWTLGTLNMAQNANTPTDKLPGLNTFREILADKKESNDVKLAVIEALMVMNRPANDPKNKPVKQLLDLASKSWQPQKVREMAERAIKGETKNPYEGMEAPSFSQNDWNNLAGATSPLPSGMPVPSFPPMAPPAPMAMPQA